MMLEVLDGAGVIIVGALVDEPSDSPQLIFIDSISLDMSSLDGFGTRWPGVKASSVPLKSHFE